MRSHSAFHLQVSLSRAPRWRCLRATLTGILVSPGLVWQAWAANKAQKDQVAARAPEREGAGFKLSGPTHVPNHPAPPSHSSQAGEREGLAVEPQEGRDSRGANQGQRISHTGGPWSHPPSTGPGPGCAQRRSGKQGLSLSRGQVCLCGSPPSSVVLMSALLSEFGK